MDVVAVVKRSPLNSNPAKTRAWQERGAKSYADRQRAQPRPRAKRSKPARNDSPWRADVIARKGSRCVACGLYGYVEIDHIWPRGQGGPSHVLNGLPLCGSYGCDAHGKKTNSTLKIEWAWLDDEQRVWLAENQWVAWDAEGQPYGRGWKHFGPRRVRGINERVETDDR